jgi:inosine/xanthosine triphosphate pyrophosphatase family protein
LSSLSELLLATENAGKVREYSLLLELEELEEELEKAREVEKVG